MAICENKLDGNVPGCKCKTGYTGNGFICTGNVFDDITFMDTENIEQEISKKAE